MIPTFNPLKDFVSIHHDNALDPDDLPAAAANLTLLQQFGAQNWVAVTGAHGQNGSKYQPKTEPLMAQIFGNRLLNANDEPATGGSAAQRQAAANAEGQMWLETINRGGNVFIAEGGQLDTSLLSAQYVKNNGGDVSRIYSIQHSGGNMSVYGPGVLSAFTALGAKHVVINDGNRDNLTPDLNFANGDILGKTADQFREAALASANGAKWKAALNYYNGFVGHSRTVDFSDTVATMHILGIPKTDAPTVFGFADRFLAPVSGPPPLVGTRGVFDADVDFLSLHFDQSPDPDDIMYAVAAKELLQAHSIENWITVTGAHGTNHTYRPATEALMNQFFGADKVLNANDLALGGGSPQQRQATANRLGQLWLDTINRGGEVYISEGGQIDTTLLAAQYVAANGGDVSLIKSVQHSQWNITHYGAGTLAAFQALGGTHVKIADGNGVNATPDYRFVNGEIAGRTAAQFKTAAVNSDLGGDWAAAISYYDNYVRNANAVDFSDAVSILNILGVPTSQAKDVFAFADKYIAPSVALPSVFSINSPEIEEDSPADLTFLLSRTGPTTNALTVNLTYSGTAARNVDYTAPGQATFAAGSAVAYVNVDPIADSIAEPNETVLLTIANGPGYIRGTADPITGVVLNDDSTVPPTPGLAQPEFSLWSGATDQKIRDLVTGDTIQGNNINFRYDNPDNHTGITNVNFLLTSDAGYKATRIEKSAPYFQFGDSAASGDVFSGNLAPGQYDLTASIFRSGFLVDTALVEFTV